MADYSYLKMTTAPTVEPISLTEVKNHLRVTGTTDNTLIASLIRVAREYCEMVQGRVYVCRTYEMAFDNGFPVVIYPPYSPLVSVEEITYLDSDGAAQTTADTVYTVDDDAEPPRIFEAWNQTWSTVGRDIENAVKVTYVAGYVVAFTAVAETDVCTYSGRSFVDTNKVRVWNSGGALPAGLTANLDYYVINTVGVTCKLSLTEGGAAVDITDTGTGTHYIYPADKEMPEVIKSAICLIVGHLYENRENTVEANLRTIPMGAKTLLNVDRVNW